MFFKRKILVVTHNGKFHADDVFSMAVLSIYLNIPPEKLNIKRTRDLEIIKKADYVLDVGFINDGERRFDHHQDGGAGVRCNGIPYATFGSIWKKFGENICGGKEIADEIDKNITASFDAFDIGIDIVKCLHEDVSPFTISDFIYHFNPTGMEGYKNIDKNFLEAVKFAKIILEREIKRTKDKNEEFKIAEKIIEEKYSKSDDKKILILEEDIPWKEIVKKYKEIIFVVIKPETDENWRIYAVRDDLRSFNNRKDFPENWAGKGSTELALTSGVEDAIFCHLKRFLCVAKTKEGAIKLAKLATQS